MPKKQYIVSKEQVSTLLELIRTKRVAIPEIQRPFVWQTTQVRDLIDSLYRSYPVGYIIIWKNSEARLKSAAETSTPDVIIDGQQRITSLQAALLGELVLNSNYKKVPIKIAFNPVEEKFETCTPAIEKNTLWIPDISVLFNGTKNALVLFREYMKNNADKGLDEDVIFDNINSLASISSSEIGTITLDEGLDIEIVAEIFKRINSKGTALDQYDFVMSKIASKEAYDGVNIRKTIDYFCHLVKNRDDFNILKQDTDFSETNAFKALSWVAKASIDVYSPSYKDIIRVAFTHKFGRGKLNDLVMLLSGRNFEKKTWDEEISQSSFKLFQDGVNNVINQTNFERFTMILQSLGFIDSTLLPANTAVDFAYGLYLYLKAIGKEEVFAEKYVQKWLIMSVLTERYSSSPETKIDEDIRKIREKGIETCLQEAEQSYLSTNYWDFALPGNLDTARASSSLPKLYWAVLCKDKTRGFLSKDRTVYDMIRRRGDIHHLYPRAYLKRNNYKQVAYNQFANFVYLETPLNIKIGEREPIVYLKEIIDHLGTEEMRLSGIKTLEDLKSNLRECDIPEMILEGTVDNYDEFLKERRKLMAAHIKRYWESL